MQQRIFISGVSSNLLVFAVSGLVSAVYVIIGPIAVLYILDLASMPMFLLRHIVAFRQLTIFVFKSHLLLDDRSVYLEFIS